MQQYRSQHPRVGIDILLLRGLTLPFHFLQIPCLEAQSQAGRLTGRQVLLSVIHPKLTHDRSPIRTHLRNSDVLNDVWIVTLQEPLHVSTPYFIPEDPHRRPRPRVNMLLCPWTRPR